MLLFMLSLTALVVVVVGEEVVVSHLVQVRPLIVEAVLVVEVATVRPAAPLMVPRPWFESGCRSQHIRCVTFLNHNF